MKKYLTMLLTITLIISALPLTEIRAEGTASDDAGKTVTEDEPAVDETKSDSYGLNESVLADDPAKSNNGSDGESEAGATDTLDTMENAQEGSDEETQFDESMTVDGVTVSVSAPEGVFPAGSKLSVKQVTEKNEKYVGKIVDEVRDDEAQVAVSYTFDIKVLDEDGNELQPADDRIVKVSFTTSEVSDTNLETDIYHITDEGEAEKLETEIRDDEVSAETDGFSFYTVEFTYNKLQYVMDGNTTISLSEILETLGLSGEVTDVEGSNNELFSASKKNGEWIVTAHQAFTSKEWMKVTINDVVYEIVVTDAIFGDDYPYGQYSRDSMVDPWRFYVCECTSFCAWRLNNANGISFNNNFGGIQWGHAYNWANAARTLGYTVDMNPAVGAIVWYEPYKAFGNGYYSAEYGHVAWVAAVDGDTVTIEEYNGMPSPYDGVYSCRQINKNSVSGYIHIQDINEDDRKPAFERGAGQTIAPGDYQIVSMVNPDMALDFQGYELVEDGARAQLFHNRDIDQDIFKLTYDSSIGCYRIQHKLSGLFLDVPDFNRDRGTFLKACHKSNPGYAQEWSIENAGDGWYTIKSRASGLYVNVESGGNTSDPSRPGIWQWDNDGTAAVKWAFVPYVPYQTKTIANGTYHIVSAVNSDMALDINGTKEGSNIRVVKNRYNRADEFKVTFVEISNGKGFYTITNTSDKLCMDLDLYRSDSGANIHAYTYNKNNTQHNQQWVIGASGGKYYIRSRHSGLYVNIANGSGAEDGANVWQYTWDGTNASLWSFVVPVKGVSLSKTSVAVVPGETVSLTAAVTPSGANKNVTWSSSDNTVATVNSNGVVTGKKEGTARITVKTAEGNKTTTCTVTVKATNPTEVGVTGVQLNKKSTTIIKGSKLTLEATITPSNATNKNVTWKSNNKKVATVDKNGKVKGIKKGTATITAVTADGKKTATCRVTVKNPVKVKSVKLNRKTASVKKGKSIKLKATISPKNATTKNVTWKSSNKKVATVDKNGKVKGIKKGTATVTVTTKDGKKKAVCKVTVN